ncbi:MULTISPECIES: SH3 domain-containing protein [Nostocales]|uniref:SH3 domain-containing protein n=3 Tax=Nostocales TaxID=1161 RepID=A0A0C1R2Q2_9CYAN|nr:SH3 domain-containing protein [Tolypothrix bouteillei]KAF3885998.1 SH3 domain-containing protein [Tolypothrix bouteillei VB521301]
MKNQTSLLKIFLISLSLSSFNFVPTAFAGMGNQKILAQQTSCTVTNIQTGQLALRSQPNGKSRAGLNNNNSVQLLRQGSEPWVYVRVLRGPNIKVNGLEGWVNSNYLICDEKTASSPESCKVINITQGQLALRSTPNGKSKAGLNNGNVVKWLRWGAEPWVYVRVVNGPNTKVSGLEGWVNSDYLFCDV